MPELPEVEHIAQGLATFLPGRTVVDIFVRWERILATHSPAIWRQSLCGLTVKHVSRRGKYLVLAVPPFYVLVHLRMTGNLIFRLQADDLLAQDPHTHLILSLADDAYLYYRDPRKFGRWYLTADPHEILAPLGPEPLSENLTPERLGQILYRKRSIKALLLDQTVIAGLGNIYTDEILWAAEIHPLTQGINLSKGQILRLHQSLREVLQQAIADGGTSLQDYRGACGERGRHQHRLSVYGRQNKACPRCSATIERLVIAQRGSYYCPRCQPPPISAGDSK